MVNGKDIPAFLIAAIFLQKQSITCRGGGVRFWLVLAYRAALLFVLSPKINHTVPYRIRTYSTRDLENRHRDCDNSFFILREFAYHS